MTARLLTTGGHSHTIARLEGSITVIAFNESTVAPESQGTGVKRQELLSDKRIGGTRVRLDRLTFSAGAAMQLAVPPGLVAWLHVLKGDAKFHALYTDRLSDVNSILLPPRFQGTLSSTDGASLLYAQAPEKRPADPDLSPSGSLFIVTNWTREAVFASEHDARKRIELARPEMCGTAAIKIEMVIYPAGSTAPSHHHEGAETFMYVLEGRGTAWANNKANPVGAGDVLYFPDREPHYVQAAAGSDLRFLEFHAPAEFKTIWTNPKEASAWLSTNRDISGRETLLDEQERHAFRFVFPFAI
jgi:quercetin dioxygenase-like cupin family protein